MRALTKGEVEFVSGGSETVIVWGYGGGGGIGGGGGGGGYIGVATGPTVAEGITTMAKEVAQEVLGDMVDDISRAVNGSDPEGDRLMNNVMSGVAGWRFGPSGSVGNVRYRTIFGPGGMYTLGDHVANGLGAWDRVSFSPYSTTSSGFSGEILTFRPGGFGSPDGYH
jgi:hypothetical protein